MAIETQPRRSRIRLCAGPRAAEAVLLDDLDSVLDGRGGGIPVRPVTIVVPSLTLRAHLLHRIAANRGAAVLGVVCRTHHHLALDLARRGGDADAPTVHDGLVAVLAERAARREPVLGRSLGHLDRGFVAVAASVRDLLDAGFRPAHAEGLTEALREETPASGDEGRLERAAAVIRVAAATAERLEVLRLASTPDLLRRAAEVVESDTDGRLAPDRLFVYGFNDATGAATDLLEALLRRYGGTVYLDRPPDPVDRRRTDPGVLFTRRFSERLTAGAAPEPAGTPVEPPRLRMFHAAGAHAEVREVAHRIRDLLAAGSPPEGIAIVARRLDPYRLALREQLDCLGIPFSAPGTPGPLLPHGRRLRALRDLLRLGPRTPVERWLEIQHGLGQGAAWHLLRHALQALGAGRLEEVAALRFEPVLRDGGYALPLRLGFEEAEGRGTVAPRRRVAARRLRDARRACSASLERLRRFGTRSTAGALAEDLAALVRHDLAWKPDAAENVLLEGAVSTAMRGLEAAAELAPNEFLDLLEATLEAAGLDRFGGAGAGVQILDVIAARQLTWDHLFLIGLNRGVFPRAVREDPLLDDGLREIIGRHGHGVLPDLPRKREGFEEERYLFAQLLDSAGSVTLSWQEIDDEGLRRNPSPLIERLRWSRPADSGEIARDPAAAPHLYAPGGEAESTGRRPRSEREAVILSALFGGREAFAAALPIALEAGGRDRESAHRLADLRVRVLDEVDPRRRDADGERIRRRLGPYLGLVGDAASGGDPRRDGRLYVTRLEEISRCPWQLFLRKVLRLEDPPDPLESLPGMDGRLVGLLVHRVLERLVAAAVGGGPRTLEEASARLPLGIPWPPEAELQRLLREASERLVVDQGIGLGGFARALARLARGHLEIARRLDWPTAGEPPAALAVEVEGWIERPAAGTDAALRLWFRADRVDRDARGLLLTDYKTGRRGIGDRRTRGEPRKRLLAAVAAGERLQAVAYALAGGGGNDRGRYLFLNPEHEGDDTERSISAAAGDVELVDAFDRAVGRAVSAWRQGLFFPRLVEPDADSEPRLCFFCEVHEACVRGDSGSRLRLRDWSHRARREGARLERRETAWLELWLGAPLDEEGGGG